MQQKDYKSIKKGDKITEYSYGRKLESTLINDPKNDNGKWTWKSKTESGQVIDYLITEGQEGYGPNINYLINN